MADPIAELRVLLAAATPAPWSIDPVSDRYARDEQGHVIARLDPPDTALVVAAINALPALLDRVERAEGEVAAILALLDCESAFDGVADLKNELEGVRYSTGNTNANDGAVLLMRRALAAESERDSLAQQLAALRGAVEHAARQHEEQAHGYAADLRRYRAASAEREIPAAEQARTLHERAAQGLRALLTATPASVGPVLTKEEQGDVEATIAMLTEAADSDDEEESKAAAMGFDGSAKFHRERRARTQRVIALLARLAPAAGGAR
jgi:DNA-binding FrmR family transcriptional regulator